MLACLASRLVAIALAKASTSPLQIAPNSPDWDGKPVGNWGFGHSAGLTPVTWRRWSIGFSDQEGVKAGRLWRESHLVCEVSVETRRVPLYDQCFDMFSV